MLLLLFNQPGGIAPPFAASERVIFVASETRSVTVASES
jgi:hypothetical protein